MCECVCVCLSAHACVCVRACVRACVRVRMVQDMLKGMLIFACCRQSRLHDFFHKVFSFAVGEALVLAGTTHAYDCQVSLIG